MSIASFLPSAPMPGSIPGLAPLSAPSSPAAAPAGSMGDGTTADQGDSTGETMPGFLEALAAAMAVVPTAPAVAVPVVPGVPVVAVPATTQPTAELGLVTPELGLVTAESGLPVDGSRAAVPTAAPAAPQALQPDQARLGGIHLVTDSTSIAPSLPDVPTHLSAHTAASASTSTTTSPDPVVTTPNSTVTTPDSVVTSPNSAVTSPKSVVERAVVQQVFPEVTRMVSTSGNGTHRITLTLQPAQLGEVKVTLVVRDGSVRVHLSGEAGEAGVRHALASGAPELQRMLERSGAADARVMVRDQLGATPLPAPTSSAQQTFQQTAQHSTRQDGDAWTGPQDQSGDHAGGGGRDSRPGHSRDPFDQVRRPAGLADVVPPSTAGRLDRNL